MSFASGTRAKADRNARAEAQRIAEEAMKFASSEHLIKYIRSDPPPLYSIEKMLSAIRFIGDLNESQLDRFWELMVTHPEGFMHCIGSGLEGLHTESSIKTKKRKVFLLDVSGSMSDKPSLERGRLVDNAKKAVSKFIQQGYQVYVIYFGCIGGHPIMSGAEFMQSYPSFNDGATYMEQSLNQLQTLVTENPDYIVDVIIITDGGISGADRGPIVEGLGSVDILVFASASEYNGVVTSHIRSIENKTRADIVKVTLINPYVATYNGIVTSVFENIMNKTSLIPGIIDIDGLKFPSVILKQPHIISQIMSNSATPPRRAGPLVCNTLQNQPCDSGNSTTPPRRAGPLVCNTLQNQPCDSGNSAPPRRAGPLVCNTLQNQPCDSGNSAPILTGIQTICDFILKLLKGTDDAINTSFISLLEGRYSGVLRVLQSIRITAERMIEKSESDVNLKYLDSIFVAAKNLQDKVSHLKDITVKKLESESQFKRAEEVNAKYIELTKVDQSLAILDIIGDFVKKLVLRCKIEKGMLLPLMRDINKIEALKPESLALVFGLISQIVVVPTTGAEKPKGLVPYSETNALEVFQLFPQLIVTPDSSGFTFTPTVAARIVMYCKQNTAAFAPDIVKLINLAYDQIPSHIMKNLLDLSASAQSNRTVSWINIAKTLPGGDEFSILQLINIVFQLCKSTMFEELSENYVVELPKCPEGLPTKFYCCNPAVDMPKKRSHKTARSRRAIRRKKRQGKYVAPVTVKTPSEIRAEELRKIVSEDEAYVFETLLTRAINSGLSADQTAAISEYMKEQPRMTVTRRKTLPVNIVFRYVCRFAMKEVGGHLAKVLSNFSKASLTEIRQMKPSAVFDLIYTMKPEDIEDPDLDPLFEPKVIDLSRGLLTHIEKVVERKMNITAVTPDSYIANLSGVKSTMSSNAGGGADSEKMFTFDKCQICHTETPSGMYKQCGHAAVCAECAKEWKTYSESIGQRETCVMCRCETPHSTSS
jgi:hypothetical protein